MLYDSMAAAAAAAAATTTTVIMVAAAAAAAAAAAMVVVVGWLHAVWFDQILADQPLAVVRHHREQLLCALLGIGRRLVRRAPVCSSGSGGGGVRHACRRGYGMAMAMVAPGRWRAGGRRRATSAGALWFFY